MDEVTVNSKQFNLKKNMIQANKVTPSGNSKSTQFQSAFDQGASIQHGTGVTAEKLPRSPNVSPSEPNILPIRKGQTDKHYDEASARPMVSKSANVSRMS